MPCFEDFRLRPLEEADLEKMLEWRNSPRIMEVMFTDGPITAEEHRSWYERLKASDDSLCLVFEFLGRPAGVVNIVRIDRRNGRCCWGFYLGESALPGGSGTVMGVLALEYVFKSLGMRKLCGEVLAFNTRSISFHKKLGFTEEGRLTRHVLKNGKYEDVVVLALFSESWTAAGQKLKDAIFCGEAKK